MNCNGSSLGERQLVIITVVQSAISCLSFISCLLAAGSLFYYKLHLSFNHRLVLYLLVGVAGMSLVHILDLPVVWFTADIPLMSYYYCRSLMSLSILTTWVSLLFSFLLLLELFSLVLCFVELRRIEIPYLCLSLILPVGVFWVPFLSDISGYRTYGCWFNLLLQNCTPAHDKTTAEYILWYVPIYAAFGLIVPLAVVIVLTMAIRWYRYKYKSHLAERRHLLQSGGMQKYSKAFKETVSLLSFPLTLTVLIAVYSFVDSPGMLASFWPELVYGCVLGSVGLFVAFSVAIHLLALGTKKRTALRKGSKHLMNRNVARSELACCVNEGEDYTTARSITVTHPTEFEPPTESDVDG